MTLGVVAFAFAGLERLRLVRNVRRPSPEQIARRKLGVEPA